MTEPAASGSADAPTLNPPTLAHDHPEGGTDGGGSPSFDSAARARPGVVILEIPEPGELSKARALLRPVFIAPYWVFLLCLLLPFSLLIGICAMIGLLATGRYRDCWWSRRLGSSRSLAGQRRTPSWSRQNRVRVTVTRYCVGQNLPIPTEVSGKMALHIQAIEEWVRSI